MKKALIGMAMAAFLVSVPLVLSAQTETPAEGYYALSYARVNYVNGDVWVQRTADLGYEKVDVNLALIQGDKMGTGEGEAEIHFGRRNYLRLARNTKVEFALLPKEGDDRIKIHVLEGSAYLRVSALPVEKGIEVDSPDASYYVLEEGLYRFDVRPDQRTVASAREGSLEAAAEEGSVVVGNGESVEASNGRLLGQPGYITAARDDFDGWNDSRDNLFQAQKSTNRYLPSEIDEYQDELDQNGHWVYEQPYGNVWVPSGVDDDWRPYEYGRWVWYPVIGWNWVSSEPWGWGPYHYGRWGYRFGLGWYWIPTHYWGPAWVHWWNDYDYIGWCPLSWYNRPAVLWNGRFYDRFYDRDFPIHNRAMSVIHRNQLQDRGLNRHVLRSDELNRVASRVSLRGEQPSIRPALTKSGPQADEARRVLGASSLRGGDRGISARPSVSGGVLRRGGEGTPGRGSDPRIASNPNRDATSGGSLRQPSSGGTASGERGIRSYPGSGSPSRGAASGSQDRPSSVIRSPRSEGSGSRETPGRTVSPRNGDNGSAARPGSVTRGQDKGQAQSKQGKESSGGTVRSGEKIKHYSAPVGRPMGSTSSSSAWSPSSSSATRSLGGESARSSRTYPSRIAPDSQSRSSVSSYPGSVRSSDRSSSSPRSYSSRVSPSRSTGSSVRTPSTSSSRSSATRYSAPSSSRGSSAYQSRTYSSPSRSSVSRSPSRSSSPSYSSSRPSAPRYSAPSSSRSSFSSPSRSSGSSGRSYSAPRSSGSSSRSSSAPRSSGSSSRSSSSSSRSSSSSGRSSSSRHRG